MNMCIFIFTYIYIYTYLYVHMKNVCDSHPKYGRDARERRREREKKTHIHFQSYPLPLGPLSLPPFTHAHSLSHSPELLSRCGQE